MLFTTKKLLHKERACAARFRHFFKRYRPVGDDEPIPLIDVLMVNGIHDTLWCLRATTEPCEQLARLLAADFAEHVLYLFETKRPEDHRPRRAIETARRFARGEATDQELLAARGAADKAADEVPRGARYAADAAAFAAEAAANYATCYAAEAAANAVAYKNSVAAGYGADAGDTIRAKPERLWQTAKFRAALAAHSETEPTTAKRPEERQKMTAPKIARITVSVPRDCFSAYDAPEPPELLARIDQAVVARLREVYNVQTVEVHRELPENAPTQIEIVYLDEHDEEILRDDIIAIVEDTGWNVIEANKAPSKEPAREQVAG